MNAQLPFWNRYYHSHVVMWLGLAFPDGMILLDNPNAGFITDPMAWPTSTIQADMIYLNAQRAGIGQPEYHLYADKIFRTDQIIIAAYSAQWGLVTPWMLGLNLIMSSLRVCVEWSYGKVKYLFKSLSLKTAQKTIGSRPVDDFICATLFTNCRTCYQLDGPFRTTFGVPPPSIHEYLGQ